MIEVVGERVAEVVKIEWERGWEKALESWWRRGERERVLSL